VINQSLIWLFRRRARLVAAVMAVRPGVPTRGLA
jgi:hypothetical protein